MKIVAFFALLASAAAIDITLFNSPGHFEEEGPVFRSGSDGDEVQVLADERVGPVGPNYSYVIELSNGVRIEESGREGENGGIIKDGSFSSPTGKVTYTADENGFQPEGDVIHALPAHVHELLKIAEQQRAEGTQFDEQGFRI